MQQLAKQATGPFKGVRIIDLTTLVFGAYATQMMADLGADVIKIENAGQGDAPPGDIMRWTGHAPEHGPDEFGPIYVAMNRNKRAALLDLRNADDLAVVKGLIRTADVFISTVRLGGLERLGLGYADVKALKPDIVYVHGSGYGAAGPYGGKPAYDDLIQAQSGCADLANRIKDEPPRYFPSVIADKVAAMYLAQAIMAALFHKQRTGEGQFVETPMFEAVTGFNLVEHLYGHTFDPPSGPFCYRRLMTEHRRPYRTKDGWIGLMPYTQRNWQDFFRCAGRPDLVEDPRFSSQQGRTRNANDLYAWMHEVTPSKTTAEWLAELEPLDIPVVKVNRLDDLLSDPHLAAVGMFERHEHPVAGGYIAVRSPLNFEKTPVNIRSHPPLLGEHNDELRAEAGAAPRA